jgi:Na+-driven multidrug efflux pump
LGIGIFVFYNLQPCQQAQNSEMHLTIILHLLFQALLMAIMAGTTALVARAIGSGNVHEAAQVTRASLGLCLLISFVTVILLWIGADAMIGLFGLDEASRELSVTYTQILVGFTPVFAISMVLGTAQRAAGDAKTPLYIGLLTNTF